VIFNVTPNRATLPSVEFPSVIAIFIPIVGFAEVGLGGRANGDAPPHYGLAARIR
jgi:hypothetical protein